MPLNGTTFTRLYSWVADAANGIKIRADRSDADANDIAAGITAVATSQAATAAQVSTFNGYFNGVGAAPNFRATLLLAGNGPWANPASGDTEHLFEGVNDNSLNQVWAISSYGASANGNNMHFNRYFGTLAAPATLSASGVYFMSQGFRGWDGSGVLSQSMAAHQCRTTEAWDTTHHGIDFHWEVTKSGGSSSRLPAMNLAATAADGAVLNLGDGSSLFSRIINNSATGAAQIHGDVNQAGAQSIWYAHTHGTNPDEMWHRSARTVWQNIAGTEFMRATPSGLAMNKGADATYTLDIKAAAANAFIVIATGGTTMLYSTNGAGTFASGENAANSSLYVRKDGTTSRSINAAGTINASGADYAEYMFKADGCGEIAKGQVVGIDADGKLTDRWAAAVSFAVKSTNPSYVGGDVWGHADALGLEQPVEPVFVPEPYTGADSPALLPSKDEDYAQPIPAPVPTQLGPEASEEDIAAAQALDAARAGAYERYLEDRLRRVADRDQIEAAHAQAKGRFDAERAAYEASVEAARAQFETDQMVPYRAALEAFNAAHEVARLNVDRIAFSGQVPVNVLGARPGDHIVPDPDGDGIKGVPVAAPTFEQYLTAVGRVIAIEVDGRARIIVKVA